MALVQVAATSLFLQEPKIADTFVVSLVILLCSYIGMGLVWLLVLPLLALESKLLVAIVITHVPPHITSIGMVHVWHHVMHL